MTSKKINIVAFIGFIAAIITIAEFLGYTAEIKDSKTTISSQYKKVEKTATYKSPTLSLDKKIKYKPKRTDLKTSNHEISTCSCNKTHPVNGKIINLNKSYDESICLSKKAHTVKCDKNDDNYRLCEDEWGNPNGTALKMVCS